MGMGNHLVLRSDIAEDLFKKIDRNGYPNSSNLHKKVVAIGINPSTATTGKSDVTMTKLCKFLDLYGYDNVKMINLYSDVTPKLTELKRIETDFEDERQNLEEADIILLVWGIDGYEKRKQEAFDVLLDYKEKIYCIKNPKDSYPIHPSRMLYDSEIIKVDSLADLKKCGLK